MSPTQVLTAGQRARHRAARLYHTAMRLRYNARMTLGLAERASYLVQAALCDLERKVVMENHYKFVKKVRDQRRAKHEA